NQNLSFETPSISGYQYNITGGSWNFAGSGGSGSGILSNGSGFSNPNAPAGTQAAFLQGYGKISQVLGGFTPGNVYTVTYSAAQRTSVTNGGESWDVTVDDKVIKSNTPGTGSYTSYSASFTATSALHTLAFAGTDLAGNDNTVFIDNLSISSTLSPPTGLGATAGNTQAGLSWTAASGATSYNVKRATTSGGPYTTLTNVATTSYTDTGLTNGTTYYYVASALNSGGESGNSGQTSVLPLVTIANSSFETPALTAGAFQYSPTGGTWTFTGASPSGSGLVSNGSGFSNPNAPVGTQAAFVQEFGTLSQALTGLNIGTTYTVTFSAAQRSGANQHGGESWNVKIDSTLVGSYNPGTAATSYVDYTATFTATAGTQTLSFVGTDLATGDNTVFIDNVRIAVNTATPPSPWVKADIGVSGAASSATYASGVFTVNGAGTNVGGTADSFGSLYQLSSADCSVTLRVATLQNTNANAKAGVMVRESLNANASEAGVWVTPTSGIVFTTRSSTGGATTTTASTGKAAPYWVRITRTGNAFAAYYSSDGSTWTQLGTSTTIAMASSAYVGLGVDSGDANQLSTATLDNVTAVP
ncbi:MAG: hypothetical protein JWO82_3791, partial [Akkermansiaceae bacterium]|nr:hypothetical protein [Akkermansiaceae bacterium]